MSFYPSHFWLFADKTFSGRVGLGVCLLGLQVGTRVSLVPCAHGWGGPWALVDSEYDFGRKGRKLCDAGNCVNET